MSHGIKSNTSIWSMKEPKPATPVKARLAAATHEICNQSSLCNISSNSTATMSSNPSMTQKIPEPHGGDEDSSVIGSGAFVNLSPSKFGGPKGGIVDRELHTV